MQCRARHPEVLGKDFDLITLKLVISFFTNKKLVIDYISEHMTPTGYLLVISAVTRENLHYALPRTKAIAMNEAELSSLLRERFNEVKFLQQDFTDDNGLTNYLLCSMPKQK